MLKLNMLDNTSGSIEENLNTSHVKVKQSIIMQKVKVLQNLNTSHVKVKLPLFQN